MERADAMSPIPPTIVPSSVRLGGVIHFSVQCVRTGDRVQEVTLLPPIDLFWGATDPIIPVKLGRKPRNGFTGGELTTNREQGHSHISTYRSAFPAIFARSSAAHGGPQERIPSQRLALREPVGLA